MSTAVEAREKIIAPESDTYIVLDTAKLWDDNPAAKIINDKTLERMEEAFSTRMFEPVQVVRVETFDPQKGVQIITGITDGNTREFFSHRYIKGNPAYPNFDFSKIRAKNVTEDLLRHTDIVPPEERVEGKTTLTMAQYLRAVVPATIKHTQIAPDRIAAHLINGWESIVGKKLADRYSVIAALDFIARNPDLVRNQSQLVAWLGKQNQLIVNETKADRELLVKGLISAAETIRASKILETRIRDAAFDLSSSGAEAIGGEIETNRQIRGLLYSPIITHSLERQFGTNSSLVEQQRALLARKVVNLIRTGPRNASERRQLMETISGVLQNSVLSFDNINKIIEAESPILEYSQATSHINADKLASYYGRTRRLKELSDFEQSLIVKLGAKTYLTDIEMQTLSSQIERANRSHTQALQLAYTITHDKAELEKKGISPEILTTAANNLKTAIDKLATASNTQLIASQSTYLSNTTETIKQRFDYEQRRFQIGKLVGEIFSTELSDSGFSQQIEDALAEYLIVDEEVQALNPVALRQRIEYIKGFNPDIRSRLLRRDITFSYADQLHRGTERQRSSRPSSALPTRESPNIILPVTRSVDKTPVRSEPSVPSKAEGITIPDLIARRKTGDEARIRHNNQVLAESASRLAASFREIDIDSSKLSPETKQALDQLLVQIGRIRFGHPDIARVIENYPSVLASIKEYVSGDVYKQIELLTELTRTSQ